MLKRTFTFIMLSSAFIGAFGVIDHADARICRNPYTGKPINCITRPYMHDISAFNPVKTGKKTAIATIELKKTSRGWKPTSKTGKWTRTWSDDYLKQFNPTINGDRATVKVKLRQTKRGWKPVEPIQ